MTLAIISTYKNVNNLKQYSNNPVLFYESTVVRPGQKSVNYNVTIYVILVNNNLADSFIGAGNRDPRSKTGKIYMDQ
jgi:hypothetical protein